MPDIICPNCGTVFSVDDMTYASISKQVRDKEFEKELRLSALIQDSAPTYRAMAKKNNAKKLMCKIACVLVLFTSFGIFTGFEVKQHQRFNNFVKANTETSVISQDGLPVDDYGFFDYN